MTNDQWLSLVPRRFALVRLLQLRIVAGVEMQVVLVDIDDFHALPLALERERPAGFHGLHIVDGAFPVAMVQLCRADQGIETRRINLVLDALGHDLNTVVKLGQAGSGHLTEVRSMLEPVMVRLAASRADEEDIRAMDYPHTDAFIINTNVT